MSQNVPSTTQRHVSEAEARRVAEESREAEWKRPSFMKELFLGNFRFDLIHPYPRRTEWRPESTSISPKESTAAERGAGRARRIRASTRAMSSSSPNGLVT